jgi:plasmid stabilization system protein ParE
VDFEIDWTEAALRDFEDAVRHVARHNVAAADQLRLDLLDSVEALARFPYIGPVYERERSNRTREIGCRAYRIFYRVEQADRRVQILVIQHASRREPRLPG